MPEAFSTPNFVALPITSQKLGRGGLFAPQPKLGLSNSSTTMGLIKPTSVVDVTQSYFVYTPVQLCQISFER